MSDMKDQLDKERSSLGRFLQSLRVQEELNTKQISKLCQVELELWKAWEMDFATPSREELLALIQMMRWRTYVQNILWKLWEEAARFRLKRMTQFRGEALAARGLSVESGIAWKSIGKHNQQKLIDWGKKYGLDFPHDLAEALNVLKTEEDKDAWVDQVLGD